MIKKARKGTNVYAGELFLNTYILANIQVRMHAYLTKVN